MVTDHDVTPRAAVNWSAEDLYEQFVAGRLAMINAASVRVSTIQEQLGRDNVDFMLWPSAEAGSHAPGVSLGWAVGVWSGSQEKEAAGRFLDYMTGPEADALWVEVGGQIPMRSSTIDDLTAFFEQPHNRFLATTATGFGSFAYLTPIEFDIGGWRQDLNQAAQDVIVGGMTPQQALEQAEQRFNQRNR
jgi:multiple sugar transport system substrate-binding protein